MFRYTDCLGNCHTKPPKEHYTQEHYPQEHYTQEHYPQEHYPQEHYPQEHYPQEHYLLEHYPTSSTKTVILSKDKIKTFMHFRELTTARCMSYVQEWAADDGTIWMQREERYVCRLTVSLKVAPRPLDAVIIVVLQMRDVRDAQGRVVAE